MAMPALTAIALSRSGRVRRCGAEVLTLGQAVAYGGQDAVQIGGLDHMLVKAGVDYALAGDYVAPGGEGDQCHIVVVRHGAQGGGYLVAVHAGHAQVEQHGVRLEGAYRFQAGQAGIGNGSAITVQFEEFG
jgi:hypothetical protein